MGVLDLTDEVTHIAEKLHTEQPEILDAARKYRKRVLVHDLLGPDPTQASFIATPDGEWLMVDQWRERQRRRVPAQPRDPRAVLRNNLAAAGPDLLTRTGTDPLDAGALFDDFLVTQFEATAGRFQAAWDAGDTPIDGGNLQVAVIALGNQLLGVDPDEPVPDDDEAFKVLSVVISAGYLWRLMETQQGSAVDSAVYPRDAVRAIIDGVSNPTADHAVELALAADEVASDASISLTATSPGGVARGGVFFWAGFEYVASDLLGISTTDDVEEELLRSAFYVGAALRDVEVLLPDR